MKKITLVLAAALSLLLTSCGKIDSSKWLVNLEDGKKAAQAEDKKILLFFSTDEDGYSKDLKDGLFQTPEFLTALTAEYVLVNLDFSTARFQSVIPSQDMSKSEIKTLQENQKKLDADMKWTTFYDLEMTPAFFVLTKHWRLKNQPKRVASRIIFLPWSNGSISDRRPRSESSLAAAKSKSRRLKVSVLRAASRSALPEEGLSS